MQSLVQKMTTTAILLLFLLAHAHADDTVAVPDNLNLAAKLGASPATIQFVRVYTAYAKAIQDHGIDGVKAFATPDFVMHSQGQLLRGEAAFKELGTCMIDTPGTRFTASIRPLTVTGTDAVVMMQDAYAFYIQTTRVTATYYWKQNWHKTTQGWKIAIIEKYGGDFDKAQGAKYTIQPKAKSEPAKTQAKQNVVK